jgi:hypothetical protein
MSALCSSARVLELAQTLAESERYKTQQAEFQVCHRWLGALGAFTQLAYR